MLRFLSCKMASGKKSRHCGEFQQTSELIQSKVEMQQRVLFKIIQNINFDQEQPHEQQEISTPPFEKVVSVYLPVYSVLEKSQYELGLSVGLIDEDLFKWRLCFQGVEGTPFEGGLFSATLTFPEDFPHMPPKMVFKSEMFHPNIYPNGEVCISILHPPFEDPMNPQERLDQKWNPVLTIEAVIVSVNSMLVDPNLDSPANVDAAKMFKQRRQDYNKKNRQLAEKSICF